MAAPLKILYVAPLDERSTCALSHVGAGARGQQVIPLDTQNLFGAGKFGSAKFWLGTTLGLGPIVARFNRDVLRIAREHRPDVMWGDKLLFLRPKTLDALRAMGIATVNYTIDNPFGPRRDPRLGSLSEVHSSLRSACGAARPERDRLQGQRRARCAEDTDGV